MLGMTMTKMERRSWTASKRERAIRYTRSPFTWADRCRSARPTNERPTSRPDRLVLDLPTAAKTTALTMLRRAPTAQRLGRTQKPRPHGSAYTPSPTAPRILHWTQLSRTTCPSRSHAPLTRVGNEVQGKRAKWKKWQGEFFSLMSLSVELPWRDAKTGPADESLSHWHGWTSKKRPNCIERRPGTRFPNTASFVLGLHGSNEVIEDHPPATFRANSPGIS